MKANRIFNLLFAYLVIGTLSLTINSCSKDDSTTTPITPLTVSAEKTQYAPYEIVTINASQNIFPESDFNATINGMDVEMSSTKNVASFVLPNLPNENYNLSFTLNDKNYIVPITVSTLTNVLDADQYFNEIKTKITASIDALNSQIAQLELSVTDPNEYANLHDDVLKYHNLLNDYTTSYNNLSITEKQEFAQIIAANKAYIDEYNNLTEDLYTSSALLRNAQAVQDHEAQVNVLMAKFVLSVTYTAAHIPFILAGGKVAAASAGNPLVLLALGVVVTSFMVNVSVTSSLAATLVNKSIKPYEFITIPSQIVYNSGVEVISSIQAKYRSLIGSDNNNPNNGSTIIKIVEKYNYFIDMYNGLVSSLPSIIRPSYVMTSLKSTFNSVTRSVHNQDISISNISNPNVTVQQINQPDGSIKIKATTTASTEQTFTYKVSYTNDNFTKNLSSTVNAKVGGECTLTLTTSTSTNSAYAYASGGQTPYTYLWSTGSTDATASNLTNNTNYTVTVTDGAGCVKTATATTVLNRLVGTWTIQSFENGVLPGNWYITEYLSCPGIPNYAYSVVTDTYTFAENLTYTHSKSTLYKDYRTTLGNQCSIMYDYTDVITPTSYNTSGTYNFIDQFYVAVNTSNDGYLGYINYYTTTNPNTIRIGNITYGQ